MTINGVCLDTKGKNNINSGCDNTKPKPSVTIKTTTNSYISPGTVWDNAGNGSVCPGKSVKVDKDFPTCQSTGWVAYWLKGKQTIYGKCSDVGSGCTGNKERTFDYTVSGIYSPGTVCDNVNNCTPCDGQTVYVDNTPPSISCSISNNNKAGGVTVKIKASDSHSGLVPNQILEDSAVKSSQTFEIYDNVYNKSTCHVTITTKKQKSTRTPIYTTETKCTYKGGGTAKECTSSGGKSVNQSLCNTKTDSFCCAYCSSVKTLTGWSDWSDWKTVSSCTKSDSTKCRTLYSGKID